VLVLALQQYERIGGHVGCYRMGIAAVKATEPLGPPSQQGHVHREVEGRLAIVLPLMQPTTYFCD
jgi:hypothetical protein